MSNKSHQLILALALLLTALVFGATLRFDFIYDDWPQIVSNPVVQAWHFVPGYFIHHVWSHIYPTWPGNYYRPLFLVWLRLNHALFGLQPFGWHLTTVLAHLGVTWMVYWLALRLTRDRVTSAIAALLFGVHPTHIETVAWVSGVSEPLLALFFIPAFVLYLESRETTGMGGRGRLARVLSYLCYAGALLSKETSIVLPGLVFGYEWLRVDTGDSRVSRIGRAIRGTIPYILLSVAYLVARQLVLKSVAHPEAGVTPLTVVLTWPSLVIFYLWHLVAPVAVNLFYDVGYVTSAGLMFWLPLLVVLAIVFGLSRWAKASSAAAMAALWLFLPLVPPLVSIAVFENGEIVHDRYLYLPSIGFAILVAMAITRIPASRAEFFALPASRIGPVFAVAALFAVLTATQSIHWANNLLLYHWGVQQAPQNALARIHLGTEMLKRGDPTSAMRLYHEAHDLAPEMWSANFVLGFAYYQIGRPADAETWLRAAARITPQNPNQYFFLALVLLQQGRYDEAEASARHALELWPKGAGFHYAVGMALEKKGQLAAARAEYEAELKNDPTSGAAGNIREIDKRLAR